MALFTKLILAILCLFTPFIAVMPTNPGADAPDTLTNVNDEASKFCGTMYFYNIPTSARIESNTCGTVFKDLQVKAVRAINEDCVTCWFYTGENCSGDIVWYGRIAPKEEIQFNPARSYICRS